MEHPELSIIIPIYNEAENIPELSRRLEHVLKEMNTSYEILAVSDGSTDQSMHELAKISRRNPAWR